MATHRSAKMAVLRTLDPTKGLAPGPYKGPYGGPLDPTPIAWRSRRFLWHRTILSLPSLTKKLVRTL